MKAAKVGRWVRVRIVGVACAMTFLFAAIAYRAYGLQIRGADHYRELAQRQHIATVEVPAPRGAIYDSSGAELAGSADIDSVYVNPREVRDLGGTAEKLAAILDLDARGVEARLASPRYFAWIERHISHAEARAVRTAALPGVYLTPEPRRFYPNRSLAGTVLGFAGVDGSGLDGIELTMDDVLEGERASAEGLRDATGQVMLPDAAKAVPGATVTLTLDRFIQFSAEQALARALTQHHAIAGVIIAIDVKTGDVLALASAPTFDPNQPAERPNGARNRAVTDVFEIGSIMKVFSVAAALDAGAVVPTDTFDVERGRMQVGRKVIRDTFHDDILTVGGVLKRSSNVGAVKIARRLGKEKLHQAFLRFGFGAKTGIELPGEEPGLVYPPKRWGEIGLATRAYGYGLSVTPLQVAAAFAAMANGGVYHSPRIVREVRAGNGRVIFRREVDEGRRVLSAETAAALRTMLASVFEKGKDGGTARNLLLDGFRAGGKTGTAHKIDPATGGYGDHLYLSSFAGFAPLDDPRVLVLVLIDEPHGQQHYGAQVAGPPWVEVMNATLRYLGVPAEVPIVASGEPGTENEKPELEQATGDRRQATGDGRLEEVGEGAPVEVEAVDKGVGMPDFVGMGMGEALEIARQRGVRVEVVGSGRAIEQFPPPGSTRTPAQCRIVFAHESREPARSR